MAATSMKELVKRADLKRFIDPRLIKALNHPVREHALATFNERIASGTEIGEEIGADVSLFFHHIEELERLGCIERVETKRRRGAVEHFYRARSTLFLDEATWQRVPLSMKTDFNVNIIQSILDEVVQALLAETLNTSREEHVSWTPGRFDAAGWAEVRALMAETLERLNAIKEGSTERLLGSDESPIAATVAILGFETGGKGVSSSTDA